jgi:threonylcarbamoyladenosine tRNA methylthiotransferase MtaB
VQDGCDAFCAYCIVPYLRCRMNSRPQEAVQRQCRDLVAAGHREIVVTGVCLGAYGHDTAIRSRWSNGPSALAALIRRLAGTEGLWRLRLSSLDCRDITEEFLAACTAGGRVAPHFHLPLQSGSDRILRRMNRRYTVEQFLQAAARLRAAFDRPAITTDVLVGFPGEEDGDFAATLDAARAAGFAKIHTFPFSPIAPTAGWAMRRQAAGPAAVRDRMAALAALEAELATAYRGQFVGQTLEALVEGRAPSRPDSSGPRQSVALPPSRIARTDRYFTVALADAGVQPGDVVRVTLDGQVVARCPGA